ncbi:hypothetical protein MIB92_10365 [Aestuariirhabdus sp. Z084]|uniref:hypothetical protein n=1 Tax=Aestuariirhabdus haliotis TaxID=2918751 RepID=UPI00201B3643|nr:hypothetical protein [Aestuariirhabdus haliotis]MCL6416057.1 hypothetical protein [Aestuariirhabdus haliotis]MCL6419375.1 hypothetical protein [Aestuariirhabdus haliotis]
MAISLHSYNIVRITDGQQVHNCTVIKMCYDYAIVKYQGECYRVPYHLMDQVVGHELLMPTDAV